MNAIATNLYNYFPPILQNLAVTGYGLKVYRREYGTKLEKLLDEWGSHEWLSLDELRQYQEERLKALVAHAYNNVPYYRRVMDARKLKPVDIRSLADLPKLPLLTRDDVRNHLDELVDSRLNKHQLHTGHTSGTTGSPLSFYWDDYICLVKNAVDWRQKRWAGIKPGDRIAFFLGRMVVPLTQSKPPFWRHNWLLNHLFFSSFHMSSPNLAYYLEKLRQFKPVAVEGYPSTIYLFARYLDSCNERFPVKAVFTSSETLHPLQRELIEDHFAAPLFDFYGMAERVVFATECEQHEGKHLNSDFGITELVDSNGQPVAHGSLGKVVATGLYNMAMPMIRYVTNDVTAVETKPCICKRSFPLMQNVTTKAEDIITTSDGRFISSSILTHPFKPMQTIIESQIVQEDRQTVVIKIIPRPEYSEIDTQYLLSEFRKRLGIQMKISVELVESIPRTSAGKFRWVISKVPLEL